MAVRPQTIELYQAIRKEFDRLSNVKKHGVKQYSNEYILATVAAKFFKSPKTVENIVFNRVTTQTTSQYDLFKPLQ